MMPRCVLKVVSMERLEQEDSMERLEQEDSMERLEQKDTLQQKWDWGWGG